MLIDRKDIEDTASVVVSLCLRSETLALRCLGHLQELGADAKYSPKDGLPLVNVTLPGREMDRVNFALYLVEQWSASDAELQ